LKKNFGRKQKHASLSTVIPIIYVPLLMITHVVAFYLLVRQQQTAHRAIAGNVAL
jgi:hypothetical protein